jgi:hypothetical protein
MMYAAAGFSETSVSIYQTTWCYIPQEEEEEEEC